MALNSTPCVWACVHIWCTILFIRLCYHDWYLYSSISSLACTVPMTGLKIDVSMVSVKARSRKAVSHGCRCDTQSQALKWLSSCCICISWFVALFRERMRKTVSRYWLLFLQPNVVFFFVSTKHGFLLPLCVHIHVSYFPFCELLSPRFLPRVCNEYFEGCFVGHIIQRRC